MKYPFFLEYRVTSPYGNRILDGQQDFHHGIDLVCDDWTVLSTDEGDVVASMIVTDKTNDTWEWGNFVCVRTSDWHYIYYCHLSSRNVEVGDKVRVGSVIGIMGNTGYAKGAHLHYEVRVNNKSINAADYLGIKNQVGLATPAKKDDEGMTPAEKKEFEELKKKVAALEKEFEAHVSPIYNGTDPKRYKADELVPNWARYDIDWLMNMGYLRGSTDGNLHLGYDMLRVLVVMSRALQAITGE